MQFVLYLYEGVSIWIATPDSTRISNYVEDAILHSLHGRTVMVDVTKMVALGERK